MVNHSVVSKAVLLLLVVSLISVNAVDWSSLTSQQLSQLPTSDFVNVAASDIASIPPAACSGFQVAQIAAINVAAISGFTDAQLSSLPSESCSGFSGAQMSAFAPERWTSLSPSCVGDLSTTNTGGCTGFSATVFEKLNSNQLGSITASCMSVIPPPALNTTKVGIYYALSPAACAGFTAQQAPYFPIGSGFYFSGECIANFSASLCSALTPTFLFSVTASNFGSFTGECVSNLAPDAFTRISSGQFSAIDPKTCSSFSRKLVRNLPKRLAPSLSAECLSNFTADACNGITFDFNDNIVAKAFPGYTAMCISSMTDGAIKAFDSSAIALIPPKAFAGFTSLSAFQPSTIKKITLDQWKNVGINKGGATGFGILEAVLDKPVLSTIWTVSQTSNFWQTTQFMNYVNDIMPYNQDLASLMWNTTANDLIFSLTWIKIALLQPGQEMQWVNASVVAHFPIYTIPGLRTDQIQSLPPQIFQEFTSEQAKVFSSAVLGALNGDQLAQLKPESFYFMNWIYLRPSVIPNITIAQLHALHADNFEFFSCDQLKRFTTDQINALNATMQNSFNNVRSKCMSWSDSDPEAAKLTLVEIVLIGCGAGILVIAMVLIAVVKIKKSSINAERAPLLGAEDGRVNTKQRRSSIAKKY